MNNNNNKKFQIIINGTRQNVDTTPLNMPWSRYDLWAKNDRRCC